MVFFLSPLHVFPLSQQRDKRKVFIEAIERQSNGKCNRYVFLYLQQIGDGFVAATIHKILHQLAGSRIVCHRNAIRCNMEYLIL